MERISLNCLLISHETVAEVVKEKQECDLLAQLFTRFALEGAQEIYQSLFPLLMVDGIDEMIIRLNADVVLELLFKQLCLVADNTEYEALVKRLVRTLGHFGAVRNSSCDRVEPAIA